MDGAYGAVLDFPNKNVIIYFEIKIIKGGLMETIKRFSWEFGMLAAYAAIMLAMVLGGFFKNPQPWSVQDFFKSMYMLSGFLMAVGGGIMIIIDTALPGQMSKAKFTLTLAVFGVGLITILSVAVSGWLFVIHNFFYVKIKKWKKKK